MTTCPLPRAVEIADTPHTLVDAKLDMQRDQLARDIGLDLAGCNVCSIVMALNEFDLTRLDKMGHRFETWPADVQAKMHDALAGFSARNGGAQIAAITQAIGGTPKAFILALHWRPKAA
jgi:hypothetical protein